MKTIYQNLKRTAVIFISQPPMDVWKTIPRATTRVETLHLLTNLHQSQQRCHWATHFQMTHCTILTTGTMARRPNASTVVKSHHGWTEICSRPVVLNAAPPTSRIRRKNVIKALIDIHTIPTFKRIPASAVEFILVGWLEIICRRINGFVARHSSLTTMTCSWVARMLRNGCVL